jgi:hypothetical protein
MTVMKTMDGERLDLQPVFNMVAMWADKEMRELWRQPQEYRGGLFMGCAVWGAQFYQRFKDYCLSSMLTEANLAVLRGNSHLAIFTDRMGFGPMWELRKRLDECGIANTIHEIPAEIIAEVPKHALNRYWPMGTAHNLAIQMAGRQGRAFHMLSPDVVTCPGYYANLMKLGKTHEGIAQTTISALESTVVPELEARRSPDGTLIIPDRDLGDIAWRHLHKQMQHFIMNDRDIETEMVRTTWLGWRGRDRISLYSPHLNPAYMSPRLCVKAPMRIPATIDAELPSFIPQPHCYVAEIADGLTLIEVSDETKADRPELIDFPEFAASAWGIMKFSDAYVPYMATRGEVPVHPQKDFLELDEIERRQAAIMHRLVWGNGESIQAGKAAASLVALSKIMDMGAGNG